MDYFVIQRDDGKFVAVPGERSYTDKLQFARTYESRERAELNRCPENEVVVRVEVLLHQNLQKRS